MSSAFTILNLSTPTAIRIGRRRPRRRSASGLFGQVSYREHWYGQARGVYRIFNAAGYRFYRGATPPAEGDAPFATSATLPYTPSVTFPDGTWYLAVSYFNGVLDSGFLPVGPHGESFLRLDLADGQTVDAPPAGPNDWHLSAIAGGQVQVTAVVFDAQADAGTQWAMAYTTDGSDPPADAPSITVDVDADNALKYLQYCLPAQPHGTQVKVRLQLRRLDGASWTYSEASSVLSILADADGPAAPWSATAWPGELPQGAQ